MFIHVIEVVFIINVNYPVSNYKGRGNFVDLTLNIDFNEKG